jgi:serine/threonine protein phosphatase PrpC
VAEADTRAHAITRWLGVDSGAPVPSTVTSTVDGPGWLLVCSDGLWNYCSGAAAVGDLIESITASLGLAQPEPLAVAEALVAWANDQGGHDNITAAVLRAEPI